MGHTDPVGLLGIEGIEQEAVLGRGAFGVVYRAWQPALQRPVAVKVLSGAFDPPALRRFERECATVGSLSGEPGIVTVYAAGRTSDGSPFLVMPYLPGGSLADRLGAGPLPPGEVASIGVAIARALGSAHRRGVLHLDVKPANVLLDTEGRPHLADFGIARFVDAEQQGHTATVAGTPGFAAPEIFDGRTPTPRSDVYGVGATLHALAGGRTPFTLSRAGGLSGLLHQIAHQDPPDLRAVGVPSELAAVIERAMAKDPRDRFATMEELVDALGPLASTLAAGPAPAPVASGDADRPRQQDDPGTLDEQELLGAGPPRHLDAVPASDGTVLATGRDRRPPRPQPAPPPVGAVAGGAGAASSTPVELEPAGGAQDGALRRRRWLALAAVVVVLVVVSGGIAAMVAGDGDEGDAVIEDLAAAEPTSVEDEVLFEWLSAVGSIDRRLSLARADFAGICRDGLERLEQDFGGVEVNAARLIPTGLSNALSAQSEPARSLWVELVDATITRYRDCAAEVLPPERDQELSARIEQARSRLLALLEERAAVDG